jgi:hypothetical protein
MKKLLLTGIAVLLLATGAAHAQWSCTVGPRRGCEQCSDDVGIEIHKLATDVEEISITGYTRRYNKAGDEVGPRGSVITRNGATLKWDKHGPWFNGKRCRLIKKEEDK